MLRAMAAAACAALRRPAAASARALPSTRRRHISTGPVLIPRSNPSTRRRSTQHLSLVATAFSRGYARMRRRSPPVQTNPEEEESEMEYDVEGEDLGLGLGGEDDEGKESEEWEGFVMDFGAIDKVKDKDREKDADEEGF